jgi:adenylate cyclase
VIEYLNAAQHGKRSARKTRLPVQKKTSITTKTLSLSGAAFLLSAALFFSGILDNFELKAFDAFSRKLNPQKPGDKVIILKVDQQSLDALAGQGVTWPWPRQVYAPILTYMSKADAVIMDILYTEPSSYGTEDDAMFGEGIAEAGNVYLPVFLTNSKREFSEEDMEFLRALSVPEAPAPLSFRSAILPIPALRPSLKGIGNVTIPPDGDGVYRRTPLVFRMGDLYIPHLLLGYLLDGGHVHISEGGMFVGGRSVPLAEGRLTLRYFREERPFTEIPAVDVLRSYLLEAEGKEPVMERSFFAGKAVLVGLTAAGLYDLKPTSITSISTGVHVHATALENLMNGNFMTPLSPLYTVLFMLIASVSITFVVLRFHSLAVTIPAFAGALLVVLFVPAALFRSGIYLHIIFPSLALVAGFIISAAYSYATEGRERRFVRRAFSQYMDERVVKHLLENPDIIQPGGQKKRVTVFFTDIAGFTTISERLPAEETAGMLHRVLNELTEVIIARGGVIDKYIGDAIMAFWGSPLRGERDEQDACCAAIESIARLGDINADFQSRRVGIHSGEAIAGNLGSDRLFDFTVIGDTVNLGSRLEGVNKVFGTRIIISEETLKGAGELFLARPLGPIEVKGKERPVEIFELMAEKEKAAPEEREILRLYLEGFALFGEKKFGDAEEKFSELLEGFPEDGPSSFYRTWCRELREASGLTEDWRIIKMTTK